MLTLGAWPQSQPHSQGKLDDLLKFLTQSLFSLQTISAIFLKPVGERTADEYQTIHHFLCKRIKMFSNSEKTASFRNKETQRPEYRLSEQDSMKCYRALHYQKYKPGENICEFGAVGDRFYIILEGQVRILIPQEL